MFTADSLRKPALASLIFNFDCSSSVLGIKGDAKALAVSNMPWKRSFFIFGSSISASDAGRLSRSSRSCARLLRPDRYDSTDQTPNTKAPKMPV